MQSTLGTMAHLESCSVGFPDINKEGLRDFPQSEGLSAIDLPASAPSMLILL